MWWELENLTLAPKAPVLPLEKLNSATQINPGQA